MTSILTLGLDAASSQRFEALRREFYPHGLNRIPAHVSLFHQLPVDEATAKSLRDAASVCAIFPVDITGLHFLGRGAAYTLASAELLRLHGELSAKFSDDLIPQDRQRFRPHVVVQNKVSPEEAKRTLARLSADFKPWTARAEELLWWEYLGGPWRLLERMPFATARE